MKNDKSTSSPAVVPEGTVPKGEVDLRLEGAMRAGAKRILEAEKIRGAEKMLEILNELESDTDRSEVPDFSNREHYSAPAPHRGNAKLSGPQDYVYRRMSGEEQEWRNPESDHWMAEWLRATVKRDHTQALQANAELERMFGRAALTEGWGGASGALSTGSAGALVPRPLENVVLIARDRVAKMRRFATILPMTALVHTIPTAAAMTAEMANESTTSAERNPAVASVQIEAVKGQAVAISGVELLSDSAINLVSMLATRAGGALGVLEDNQTFRDGNGTRPNTKKIDGTSFTPTTTASELSYTETLKMYYSVPQEYRDRAIWLVAADVLQLMSNVRDGQGRPFYQGLMDVPGALTDDRGQVGSILRRPVYEVPFSDGEIWFGEAPAQYVLGSRAGIQMAASEHVLWTSDQISWKWTMRFGGINVDDSASQYAKGITAATSL